MDDDGGGIDDHGSGWLEVKKRHRVSAPKVSSQNLIGGKSNTQKARRVAAHFRKSTSQKLVNRHHTTISHPPNELHNLPGGFKNSAGISDFYDRKHVNQESKACISSQTAGSLTEEASCLIKFVDEGGHGKVIEERSTMENVVSDNLKDIVSKIRWGNLDNDSFVVNKNLHSTSRSLDINCMSENSTLHGGQQVSEPNLLACSDSLEEKDVPISEATVHFSAGQDEVVEGKDDNEVNIVVSDITIIHDIKPEGVASNGGVDTLSESYTEYFDASLKLNEVADIVVANVSDPLSENIHLLAAGRDESLTQMLTCGDAVSVIAEGALESAVHGIFTSHSQDAAACASSSCVSSGDFSLIHENETCDDHVRGTPRDDMVDKTGILEEKPLDMKLTNDHLPVDIKLENDHLVDDLAKDKAGGSKERFRERLWCFLFENLNRAVDELYLLCELECDMEQMNEAILVLEEAESDFRELRSRVEGFENTKKLSSHSSIDGISGNTKVEHRRPHALSWEGSYILPSNFEEVAIGVLKVLNSLAVIDMTALQTMLARPDLQMEFFHLMSFFLSYCTSKWKSATDQVGLLLLETLLLLGYFALFHPGNQAVLRWGKSPTILHKVCDLPFVFFSFPDLTPVLAGTLVAACYGCEQNRGVVQQGLSMDMLLSVLKSCRQGSLNSRLDHASLENSLMDDTSNANRPALESRRLQAHTPVKPSRSNQKYSRVVLGKGGFSGGNGRTSKAKQMGNQKDLRGGKGVETSPLFILHNRFPSSFLDKAEEFFSSALKDNN